MSVYNLGVVDHAHVYDDGWVFKHLHSHVYHKGVGKKGANNVASLIVKTLRQLNLLCKDSVGGELNVIFDNCSCQNKNNTVLRLAAWLVAMGYFKEVNFIFLVVDHTKNAADCLFNSLKHEYHKQNLFTLQDLVRTLNKSTSVSIHPSVPEDFLNCNKLLNVLFRMLAGNIKKSHIFSCNDDGAQLNLWQSNLMEHEEFVFYLWKKGTWNEASRDEIAQYSASQLMPISFVGLNL
jgi:hypothetical protein